MGYSFRLAARVVLMHHPTDRIARTTAFVPPVVEHWLERENLKQLLGTMWTTATTFEKKRRGTKHNLQPTKRSKIIYIFYLLHLTLTYSSLLEF